MKDFYSLCLSHTKQWIRSAAPLVALLVLFSFGSQKVNAQCAPTGTESPLTISIAPDCVDDVVAVGEGIGPGSERWYSGFTGGVYYTLELGNEPGNLTCRQGQFYNGATPLGSWFNLASSTTQLAPAGTNQLRVQTTRTGSWNTTSAILIYRETTPTAVTVSVADDIMCVGGSIDLNATGGTYATSWSWSGPNSYSNSNQNPLSFTTTTTAQNGTYTVTADNAGCTSTDDIAVTVVSDPSVSITGGTTPICEGTNPGTLTASGSGGAGTTTYQWQRQIDGGGWNNVGSNSATYNPGTLSADGTYEFQCLYNKSETACNQATSNTITIIVEDNATITSNPSGGSICEGGSITLNASYTGGSSPSVQWQYFNGSWVSVSNGTPTGATYSGATSTSLGISGISVDGSYQYRMQVTDNVTGCSDPATSSATVVVNNDASITSNPSNATICAGGSANFSASYTGGTSPSVQWQYFNGSWVSVSNGTPTGASYSGATSTSLTVSGISVAGSYQYRMQVTDNPSGCSDPASSSATLTVNADASITSNPSNVSICNGGSTTLNASYTGGVSPSVQWEHFSGGSWGNVANGTPTGATYSGATTTSLGISGITTAGGHLYRMVVTDNGGGCSDPQTSSATVTVYSTFNAGNVTGGSSTICSTGDPAAMTVSPSGGSGSYSYQWYYQNGNVSCPSGASTAGWTIIGGATSATYDPPTGLTTNRTYAVVVDATGSPDCGSAVWANTCVTVTVNPLPSISVPNDGICQGETATLTADVSPNVPADGTFFWNTGAVTQIISPSPAATTNYTCTFTLTSTGCSNSAVGTVTVESPIGNNTISADQNICEGETPTALAGSSPTGGNGFFYTYQWQSSTDNIVFNDIPSAQSQSYSPGALTQTTYYKRLVSSVECQDDESNVVTITVIDPLNTNWTGAVNTTWHVHGNWSNCEPKSTTNVVVAANIGSGNYPSVYTGTAFCNNLTLQSGAFGTPGHLELTSGNNLDIDGNLTINSGAVDAFLTVSHASSDIFIAGNWNNQGSFTPSTAQVEFNGSGAQTVDNGSDSFYDLRINKSGGALTVTNNNLTVSNDLLIFQGQLSANGLNINFAGDWTNTLGSFSHGNGKVIADGTGAQSVTVNAFSGNPFYNFEVDGTGNTVSFTDNADIDNILTILNGTFEVSGSRTIDVNQISTSGGAIDVKSNGTLNVNP